MNFEEVYNIVANKLQIPEEVRRNISVQNFVYGTLMYVEQNIKKVSVTRKEDVNFLQGTIGDIDEWIHKYLAQQIASVLVNENLIDFSEEQVDANVRKYTAKLLVLKVEQKTHEQYLQQLQDARCNLSHLIRMETNEENLEHLHDLLVENESQMNITEEEIKSGKYYVGVDLADGKDFTSVVELNGDGC